MAVASGYSVLGKPIPRVEGADKVTGRSVFTADVTPPDCLWAKNVRSPIPHGRIVSIDTTRALAVPGVRAVLTAADFPNRLIGRRLKDQPILCGDRVRFVGDKVAVVAADDLDAAEEAALLVHVEYEELPAVFDPLATMEPGAPLIHPDARTYVGFSDEVPRDLPNVCAYQRWERGDVASGLARADLVVEHTFRTQLMHQGYLEPHASIAALSRPGPGGRVEVWASNKVPFGLRHELATILDRPEADILVHRVNVGGDFGSKGSPVDVPTAYYLARTTGRPVKFVLSSQEDLTAASPRHPSVVTLRSGVNRDGKIVAREARVVFNSGAYGAFKPSANGMLGGGGRAAGCYGIPDLVIEAFCVYTNQVPCGYMRAPGSPQVLFAVEAHTDLLARELGLDPLEFRLRNLRQERRGEAESMAPQVLRAAAEAIGWQEGGGARGSTGRQTVAVGRGISICERGTGVGEGSSDITVDLDGSVTVISSMPDNGTGGLTVVTQVVAEAMGVPLDRVHLIHGDTDALPVDVGSGASRMTNVAGNAVIAACDQVKTQLAPRAASMLGVAAADWHIREGVGGGAVGGWIPRTVGEAASQRFVSLEEVALEMLKPGDPAGHAQVTISTPRSDDNAYCVQAAEVEVDLETGDVRLRRLVSAQDVGTIINTIGHQSQIEGSIQQGIGLALMEDLGAQDGRITASHLGEYKIPTAREMPDLVTINIPTAGGPGPFGARAIGELPHMPTAGAVANAIADAIGAPVFELPVTAERVLAALDASTAR